MALYSSRIASAHGEHELFVGLVIGVGEPRCASRRDRGHEAFFDAAGFQRRLEMGDVGFDRVVAFVDDRPDADRPVGHRRPGVNAAVRVLIDRQKLGAVAPVGKAREHDFARRGCASAPDVVQAGAGEIEAAEPIEAIAPPGPVVDLVAHRFAEFAVAGNVDADVLLLADNVDDGFLQRLLEAPVVGRLAGFAGRGWPRSDRRAAASCRLGWSGYGRGSCAWRYADDADGTKRTDESPLLHHPSSPSVLCLRRQMA